MRSGKPFIATDPQGQEHRGTGLQGFCQLVGVNYTSANKTKTGQTNKTREGWSFRNPDESEDTSQWKHYSYVRDSEQVIEDKTKEIDLNLDGDLERLMNKAPEVAELILELEQVDPKRCVKNMLTLLGRVSLGVTTGMPPPAGWSANTLLLVLKEMTKAHGIDWDKAADDRTDAEKAADGFADLLRLGPSELLCQTDDVLDAMEKQLEAIDSIGGRVYDSLNTITAGSMMKNEDLPDGQSPGEPPGPKAIHAAAHQWLRRIRRVRELARRAREPRTPGSDKRRARIEESTHLLRYMLYVNRSTRTGIKTPADAVYIFGEIHVRSSMALHFSRNGYGRTRYGLLAPGDRYGHEGREMVYKGARYSGTLLMVPPRHGKTDIIKSDMALAIGLNPCIQMAIVHENDEMASAILESVATCFNRDLDQGRRNYRLFPYQLDPKGNNAHELRVKTHNRPMNPNLKAASVWSGGQGNNLDRLYGDDLVPQSDLHEGAKRARRFGAFHGTWGSRDQGAMAFATLTGYPRHHQDLMWQTWVGAVKGAKTEGREGLKYWAYRCPVGGPKDKPGIPAFRSIFPEVYNTAWLKDKYRSYGDRALWAANYELDPMPEDSKIVAKPGLYDIESMQTKRILDNGEFFMGMDPTSTKNAKTSDSVGLIIGALVDHEDLMDDGLGNEHVTTSKALYLTEEDEFLATMPEQMAKMLAISESRAIGREISLAIIETTGPGQALVDFLEDLHGINSVYEAKALQNKGERFRAVAGLFENSDPVNSPARVLLPGRRKRDEFGQPDLDSELEVIPEFERLYNYIVNFKVETGFHSLDATVHLVEYLRQYRSLGRGDGTFSRQAKEREIPKGVSRAKMEWDQKNGKREGRPRSMKDRRMRHLRSGLV